MTNTRTADRIEVTKALSVSYHGARIHLDTSTYFPDGEFLSSALLIGSDVARRLAAALVQMADAADAEHAEVIGETVPT